MSEDKSNPTGAPENERRAVKLFAAINERERRIPILLANIKRNREELRKLLAEMNEHRVYEDRIYRFYHQSFKVFYLQDDTRRIIAALAGIAPEGQPFCELFTKITEAGLNRQFKHEDNGHWIESTAPILQAFFHARYFLEMAVKYADLVEPPSFMPSGWAALLCLFDLR